MTSTQRERIARLLPSAVKDRTGWAADLQTSHAALGLVPAAQTFCATIAVIDQESGFQVDPPVPGLPAIVHGELERRAAKYGVPKLLLAAALLKDSPDGRSYRERIDALKTEKQLSDLFDDLISQLPFGADWLADSNPVRTGGPMQVAVAFAEQHAAAKPYPFASGKRLRDEVFSRRGGVYFGAAILLDYPVPYDDVVYRFADFNAGRYASRNAAFQSALARLSGTGLAQDGDLLRYEEGKATELPSQVEIALRDISARLGLTRAEIRRDLLLEKSAAFEITPLYVAVFRQADVVAGRALPRQAMPKIDLKSPKIKRKLTTEWFARRVETRYVACLQRDSGA